MHKEMTRLIELFDGLCTAVKDQGGPDFMANPSVAEVLSDAREALGSGEHVAKKAVKVSQPVNVDRFERIEI
jgi:hypothetical protein